MHRHISHNRGSKSCDKCYDLILQLMTVAIISKKETKQKNMQEKQDLRYLSVYLSAP